MIIFIVFLLLILITNAHNADKKVQEISELNKLRRGLKAEYIRTKTTNADENGIKYSNKSQEDRTRACTDTPISIKVIKEN